MHYSHPADVDESESDSDAVSDASFAPSYSKSAFIHLGNLDTCALKPSRIGRETDGTKVSVLPSLTTVSISSKCNLAAMADLDKLNRLADPAETCRKVARLMLATHSSVEVEPERSISKNASFHPERPVHLTLGKHRTLTATQELAPGAHCLLTQPDATPNLQQAPDATPNLPEAL